MAKQALPVKHRTRVLFVAGRIRPVREPRPCTQGHHAGPFVRRPDLDPWMTDSFAELGVPGLAFVMYDCLRCGSSVDMGNVEVAA